MEQVVTFSKKTTLIRLLILVVFVILSIFLTYSAFFFDYSVVRKIIFLSAALVGYWFCGRHMLVFLMKSLQSPVLFTYNDQMIKTPNGNAFWKDINKLEIETMRSYFNTKTPAYVLYSKNNTIKIPTNFLLTDSESQAIYKLLNKQIKGNGKSTNSKIL